MDIFSLYKNCTLCPRECGVNRAGGERGFCGALAQAYAAKAYPHMWEEPCLSGENGSGTVFFSGCNLKCVYCQNKIISNDSSAGKIVSPERLAEIYFKLKAAGVHNINLVTPTHFIPHIVTSVKLAKRQNIGLPFVYNTSGYEKRESLKLLSECIDIYLTDFKYYSNAFAKKYSFAPDYRKHAFNALSEMFLQTGAPRFNDDGMLKKGVILRHLVLPDSAQDSKKILRLVYSEFGNEILYSIMSQYTPVNISSRCGELNRKITQSEYDEVVSFAQDLGIKNCYIQTGESAKESFIPDFNGDGI